MPRNQMTDEEKKIIREMFEEGKNITEIAEVIGRHYTTIYNHLRSRNIIKITQPHNYVSSEEKAIVFNFDKPEGYCYDEASDCKNFRTGYCQLTKETKFVDDVGLRDVCPHYQKRSKSFAALYERDKTRTKTHPAIIMTHTEEQDLKNDEEEFIKSLNWLMK